MNNTGIVREAEQGVEMVQRNMMDALRQAMAALQAGQFVAARDATESWTAHPSGAVLHAIARAGAGDVAGGAAAMADIAQANPQARHPVHDLVDLLRRHDHLALIAPNLRAALDRRPPDPELRAALGAALAEFGPMDEAIAVLREAAKQQPSNPAALSNWAKALAAEGRFEDADQAFAAAMALAPTDPQLALNRGIAMLRSGHWNEAWPLFKRRHALSNRPNTPPGPELTQLGAISNQTILLVHSEGFGDTIQFIRYAPLLVARGATVILWVPPPLTRLLKLIPAIQIITGNLPRYDRWCRISDLPAIFGTTPTSIPRFKPYLSADPALVRRWADILPQGRRIGLVWAGAARPHDPAASATDRLRSIPPTRLASLLATPDICWISLQAGQQSPLSLFDPMPMVGDFADTAAIIMSLEAVVSVDTAVAHLAGALGRPVLLLDRYDHCWRWIDDKVDTPWYPGLVRIIRQPSPGDWQSVLAQAAELLTDPGGLPRISPGDTA